MWITREALWQIIPGYVSTSHVTAVRNTKIVVETCSGTTNTVQMFRSAVAMFPSIVSIHLNRISLHHPNFQNVLQLGELLELEKTRTPSLKATAWSNWQTFRATQSWKSQFGKCDHFVRVIHLLLIAAWSCSGWWRLSQWSSGESIPSDGLQPSTGHQSITGHNSIHP